MIMDKVGIHRLLWLVMLGLLVATLGCQDFGGSQSEAVLRVNREAFDGNASDYMVYKETQASLLKSNFVLRTALRNPKVAVIEGLTAQEVRNHLHVTLDETELLYVVLRHGNWADEESELILNQVVMAFMNEVVNKERMSKTAVLSKLRTRYSNLFDSIKKKTDEVSALAEQLGTIDGNFGGASSGIRVGLEVDQLRSMHAKLFELELRNIKSGMGKAEQKELEEQIQFVKERIGGAEKRLRQFGGSSGDLEARKDDLSALRRDMQTVREAMQQLEIDLDGPESVSVIQPATTAR